MQKRTKGIRMNVGTRTIDRASSFPAVYSSAFPEWDILDLYLREASQGAVSPDCSWHPLLQGSVVVSSGLKKGSMCEWRCYARVLKNWDCFTHNTEARDSPFITNSSLPFSHPKTLKWSNTALPMFLTMFQRVTKSSMSWPLFHGDRHKTNHSVMFCLLDFGSAEIASSPPPVCPRHVSHLFGPRSTMATLLICCGAQGEEERSEVRMNWISDPPSKTVKWHSNNPETLA